MERIERVNSSYDLDYDYYRKNLPAIDDSDETDESINIYEKIFESRKTFTVLGLDSYIILSKKSLTRMCNMIDCYPQEYILFTNHQIIDEDKFDKLLEKEKGDLNPIFIPEPENDNDNDVDDDGFKKVENIELNIINIEIFTKCLWLYLSLTICSLWNFLYYMYIILKTDYGFSFFSFYVLFLFGLLLFTGIYGFLKCRWRDFSGYPLKIFTFLVPSSIPIEIFMYYFSSLNLKGFWIKLIIDIITFIIGTVLVLFLFGIIKIKSIINDQEDEQIKEKLINSEKGKEEAPVYKFDD